MICNLIRDTHNNLLGFIDFLGIFWINPICTNEFVNLNHKQKYIEVKSKALNERISPFDLDTIESCLINSFHLISTSNVINYKYELSNQNLL